MALISNGESGSSVRTKLNTSLTLTQAITATANEINYLAGASANVESFLGAANYAAMKSQLSLNNVENTALSTWAGSANIASLGTIGSGTWNATAIGATKGGTGLTNYTAGDLIYASATNVLSKLAAGTNGYYLKMVSGAPAWASVGTFGTVLKSSGTASSTTNAASETNLVSVLIPGGTMNENGKIVIWVNYKYTGTAGTKSPTIRLSTTSGDVSGGTVVSTFASGASNKQIRLMYDYYNVNSLSSQIISTIGSLGSATSTDYITSSFNTANDLYINLNGHVANSGDTIQVVGYTIEYVPGV